MSGDADCESDKLLDVDRQRGEHEVSWAYENVPELSYDKCVPSVSNIEPDLGVLRIL